MNRTKIAINPSISAFDSPRGSNPTIYHTRGEHANHYTPDPVLFSVELRLVYINFFFFYFSMTLSTLRYFKDHLYACNLNIVIEDVKSSYNTSIYYLP